MLSIAPSIEKEPYDGKMEFNDSLFLK